jgi:hypothetical protein
MVIREKLVGFAQLRRLRAGLGRYGNARPDLSHARARAGAVSPSHADDWRTAEVLKAGHAP